MLEVHGLGISFLNCNERDFAWYYIDSLRWAFYTSNEKTYFQLHNLYFALYVVHSKGGEELATSGPRRESLNHYAATGGTILHGPRTNT